MISIVSGRYLWRILMYVHLNTANVQKALLRIWTPVLFDPGIQNRTNPDLGSGIKNPGSYL